MSGPTRTHPQQGTPGRIVGPGAPATPTPKGAECAVCAEVPSIYPAGRIQENERLRNTFNAVWDQWLATQKIEIGSAEQLFEILRKAIHDAPTKPAEPVCACHSDMSDNVCPHVVKTACACSPSDDCSFCPRPEQVKVDRVDIGMWREPTWQRVAPAQPAPFAPKPNATTREAMADGNYNGPNGREWSDHEGKPVKAAAVCTCVSQPVPSPRPPWGHSVRCPCYAPEPELTRASIDDATPAEWDAASKQEYARRDAQPAPFAVGERVEWVGCGNESEAVEILGLDPRSGDAWLYNPRTKQRFSDPQSTLLRPPAKRGVKQVEYAHTGGSKHWIHEHGLVNSDYAPTGRTHSYEVDDE